MIKPRRIPSGPGTTTRVAGIIELLHSPDPAVRDAAKLQLIRDMWDRINRKTAAFLAGKFNSRPPGVEHEDVASEAWFKFSKWVDEGMDTIPDTPAGVFAYTGKIIRSTILDKIRSYNGVKNQTQFPDGRVEPRDVRDPRWIDVPDEANLRAKVAEALESLSDEEKTLFDYVCILELSWEEISELMGKPIDELKDQYDKLLRKLGRYFA